MAKNEMTDVRCEIVLALADSRMRISAAAKKLYMNHTSLLYHIKLIRAITGKDPMNFYDLIDLVQMAKIAKENGYCWPYEEKVELPNEQTMAALMAMGSKVHGGNGNV